MFFLFRISKFLNGILWGIWVWLAFGRWIWYYAWNGRYYDFSSFKKGIETLKKYEVEINIDDWSIESHSNSERIALQDGDIILSYKEINKLCDSYRMYKF